MRRFVEGLAGRECLLTLSLHLISDGPGYDVAHDWAGMEVKPAALTGRKVDSRHLDALDNRPGCQLRT